LSVRANTPGQYFLFYAAGSHLSQGFLNPIPDSNPRSHVFPLPHQSIAYPAQDIILAYMVGYKLFLCESIPHQSRLEHDRHVLSFSHIIGYRLRRCGHSVHNFPPKPQYFGKPRVQKHNKFRLDQLTYFAPHQNRVRKITNCLF